MRSRVVCLTLGIFLFCILIACNKPTQPPGDNNQANPGNTAPADTSANNGNGGTVSGNGSATNEKSSKVEAPARTSVTVPAGTVITVRLDESVGSKISQPGQPFSATVAHDIQVEGNTVIASGATASGVVVDAKPLGRFKGGAVLQLKLTSLSVRGNDVAVDTSSILKTATGKGKRTGVMVGGGAGLGALIGGIAGGGKGAAIGALAGAGAGTAGSAFTGNKDIVLPAESAVSFKLEQSLVVKQ
jgi:hypothetical protein